MFLCPFSTQAGKSLPCSIAQRCVRKFAHVEDNRRDRENGTGLLPDTNPGDSNGIVYLNDTAVYTPTVLSTYDVIEMGDSKFAFMQFCGEQFMWKEKGT